MFCFMVFSLKNRMWTNPRGQDVDKSENGNKKRLPNRNSGVFKIRQKALFYALLASLFHSNGAGDGGTNHGVVAHADEKKYP